MKYILILALSMSSSIINKGRKEVNCITKNSMEVCWTFSEDKIRFALKAPTTGWVGIGFNEQSELAGTYLLLARVANGKAEIVEHFVISPGDYISIESLGATPVAVLLSGVETSDTEVTFAVPISPLHKYGKSLKEGMKYEMLIAFSREDDFQHHSTMRTSIEVTL